VISPKLKKIIDEDREYLYQNYGNRQEACFTKGDGSYLFDQDNKKYIDLFSGIAVCNLGYGNNSLSKALHRQIDNIIHTSNHYYNTEQINAAKLISELSFPGKTLFANSGTEANEAAIKLARRYGMSISKDRFQIVSFTNSFHGRTMGSMTATGQEKVNKGFGPLPRGFIHLPYNDIKSFKKEVKKNRNIAAVMLEVVQGEGGIIVADNDFIREMFEICNKNNILTIVDEVQTGIGRTGTTFGFQNFNIIPDIITLAKGLAGGLPIGAIHTKDFLTEYLGQGTHGSTFGGNHFACAAAETVLKEVKKKSLLNNVSKVSEFIFNRLEEIREKVDFIEEIRGLGLHIGIELNKPGADIVKTALVRGLIINCTAGNVLRIMPPLNIKLAAVKSGLQILEDILIEEGDKK